MMREKKKRPSQLGSAPQALLPQSADWPGVSFVVLSDACLLLGRYGIQYRYSV